MTFREWYFKEYHPKYGDIAVDAYDIAQTAWNASEYLAAGQWHGELCFFCGEKCDGFAGNPSLWPVVFVHPDGTGKPHVHHTRCVQERLFQHDV